MSHIATVNVEIQSLEHLAAACARVGLEFVPNQVSFRAYEEGMRCDHAIRIGESRRATLTAPPAFVDVCEKHPKARVATLAGTPFEIGVRQSPDGKSWRLLWDDYGSVWGWGGYGLEDVAGKGLGLLKQSYAIVAARAEAVKQGFRIQELHKANGMIELRLCK